MPCEPNAKKAKVSPLDSKQSEGHVGPCGSLMEVDTAVLQGETVQSNLEDVCDLVGPPDSNQFGGYVGPCGSSCWKGEVRRNLILFLTPVHLQGGIEGGSHEHVSLLHWAR